jgi:hypothetical protein
LLVAFLCLIHDGISVFSCMLHHVIELPMLFDQLPRCSLLHDASSLHYDDFVVVSDGVQPVGDSYHGGVCEFFADDVLDEGVSSHVDVRSGFV